METLKEYAQLCNSHSEIRNADVDPVLKEREACARLCEAWGLGHDAKYYAALIRARNTTVFNKKALQQA